MTFSTDSVHIRIPDCSFILLSGYIEGSESSHLLSGGANVPVIHALLILKGKVRPQSPHQPCFTCL